MKLLEANINRPVDEALELEAAVGCHVVRAFYLCRQPLVGEPTVATSCALTSIHAVPHARPRNFYACNLGPNPLRPLPRSKHDCAPYPGLSGLPVFPNAVSLG